MDTIIHFRERIRYGKRKPDIGSKSRQLPLQLPLTKLKYNGQKWAELEKISINKSKIRSLLELLTAAKALRPRPSFKAVDF
jgi:hypothetical protein